MKYKGKLQCNCGHIQEAVIMKYSAPKGKMGRKGAVSSQISCERCLNYIPHDNEVS